MAGFHKSRLSALALIPLLLLTQCGDQKAANKSNFKAALSKFFGGSCAVLSLTNPLADLMGGMDVNKPPADLSGATLTGDQIAALEKAGLVTQKRVNRPQTNILGQPLGTTVAMVPVLTSKGQTLWHVAGSGIAGSPAGLCDGHIEIVSVDNFTEPTTMAGVKITTVTFTMRKHLDDWAATPEMKAAFALSLAGPDTTQMTLPMQLNNDGWGIASNLPADNSD